MEATQKDFIKQVVQYFEENGYTVEEGINYSGSGVPDYIVYNDDERFWVEVKSERKDGLRDNQLKWMMMHSDEKVIVIFKQRKDSRCSPLLFLHTCSICGESGFPTKKALQKHKWKEHSF